MGSRLFVVFLNIPVANLQGYKIKFLRNSFKKFYGKYADLMRKYQKSVKDMINDSFRG